MVKKFLKYDSNGWALDTGTAGPIGPVGPQGPVGPTGPAFELADGYLTASGTGGNVFLEPSLNISGFLVGWLAEQSSGDGGGLIIQAGTTNDITGAGGSTDIHGGNGGAVGGNVNIQPGTASAGTHGSVVLYDHFGTKLVEVTNGKLALYGGIPANQPSPINSLSGFSGGNDTLVNVSGTGDDTTINNNFADLAAKINAILIALRAPGYIDT